MRVLCKYNYGHDNSFIAGQYYDVTIFSTRSGKEYYITDVYNNIVIFTESFYPSVYNYFCTTKEEERPFKIKAILNEPI